MIRALLVYAVEDLRFKIEIKGRNVRAAITAARLTAIPIFTICGTLFPRLTWSCLALASEKETNVTITRVPLRRWCFDAASAIVAPNFPGAIATSVIPRPITQILILTLTFTFFSFRLSDWISGGDRRQNQQSQEQRDHFASVDFESERIIRQYRQPVMSPSLCKAAIAHPLIRHKT